MKFPKIDMMGTFYKNCVRNRRAGAKICQVCPFREGIEAQEFLRKCGNAAMRDMNLRWIRKTRTDCPGRKGR